MDTFRGIWADHADYVSKAYSGTGALKTDFTRTGVRTKKGLLMDGQNSIMRYLYNNYSDGDRQVCLRSFQAVRICFVRADISHCD